MIPIVKSPQYERDVIEIWHHIAQRSPEAADFVVMAPLSCLVNFRGWERLAPISRRICAEYFGANI